MAEIVVGGVVITEAIVVEELDVEAVDSIDPVVDMQHNSVVVAVIDVRG